MPSVKQCASKRNSSRVNSAYMDSTIKEYLKEYYCFLWIIPMNLDKPMRYHRNNTEDRRHPMSNIMEQLTGQNISCIFFIVYKLCYTFPFCDIQVYKFIVYSYFFKSLPCHTCFMK